MWVMVWLYEIKIRKKQNCYMNTDSFKVYKKSEEIFLDIVKVVEIRFDTSNYKLETGKDKKLVD